MSDIPANTVLRDGLLRPGPTVTRRIVVEGVREIVTADRGYPVLPGHSLIQTPMQYEIQNDVTGGILYQVELQRVLWLKPQRNFNRSDEEENEDTGL